MTEYIPVFRVKNIGTDKVSVSFKCPACRKWHTHGRPRTDKPEHRCSHCTLRDAYPGGYYITTSKKPIADMPI